MLIRQYTIRTLMKVTATTIMVRGMNLVTNMAKVMIKDMITVITTIHPLIMKVTATIITAEDINLAMNMVKGIMKHLAMVIAKHKTVI